MTSSGPADVRPGMAGSAPSLITAYDGGVYFVADDGTHGARVWRSAGTSAGTTLVSSTAVVSPLSSELAAIGTTLFFSSGDQLWRSDGTEAGTHLVKDINPAAAVAPLEQLTAAGSLVWFTADDGVGGRELWRSDGTEAGTIKLTDRPPGADSKPLDNLTGRGLVALRGRELWTTDGTVRGTHPVDDTKRGRGSSSPNGLTDVGGRLFFSLDDGVSGQELWRTQRDTGIAGLRVSAARTQRAYPNLKWVKAKVGAGEWVTSVGRGRITIPGSRRWVVLRPATVTSYAGRTETLRLVIPRKARQAVLSAVGQYRHASGPGRVQLKGVARVTVKVRDSSGNAKKVVRKIHLT